MGDPVGRTYDESPEPVEELVAKWAAAGCDDGQLKRVRRAGAASAKMNSTHDIAARHAFLRSLSPKDLEDFVLFCNLQHRDWVAVAIVATSRLSLGELAPVPCADPHNSSCDCTLCEGAREEEGLQHIGALMNGANQ
jgi:hypothetical protein